ncbi:MAG: endonuclease III [Cytophagaceae bacterium]
MTRKEKYERFLSYFQEHAPQAETELVYSNAYELLLAVVLSAQCTDKRVNMVTPALFEAFPDAYALAKADSDTIFPYIRSISYPNNKAKHLSGLGKLLVEKFHGEVPSTVDELQELPGVGRKTANVIASVIWEQPTMAVDTHVFRVSHRLGLVTQTATTPLAVEKQLIKYIPEELVHISHHWLILHGRYICLARQPKCDICPITEICSYFQKELKRKK